MHTSTHTHLLIHTSLLVHTYINTSAPLIKMASPALLPAQALPQPVVVVRPKFDLSLVSADVRSENMRCNICRLLHETLRYDQRAGMRLEQEVRE